jgi:hypothetical protein
VAKVGYHVESCSLKEGSAMSDGLSRRGFVGCGVAAALGLASELAGYSAPTDGTKKDDGKKPTGGTEKGIAIPWIRGTFQHVLNPPGMAQARKAGSKEQWYINDHCFLVDPSERIHWFGITNPYPKDGNLYGPGSHRHIGHAVAQHPFGPWEERADALALPEGTSENIASSFVVPTGEGFLMVYDHDTGFYFARSSDLNTWQNLTEIPALNLGVGTRDPCILQLEDGTYVLYAAAAARGHAGRGAVVLASSHDLIQWKQEEPALLTDMSVPEGALESPFVHRRGDDYYLFVNFSHRQYEETLVFQSKNPRRFDWRSPLCTLFAHAAELLTWRGRTYISHCGIEDRHWSDIGAPYGLWLAELRWAEQIMVE